MRDVWLQAFFNGVGNIALGMYGKGGKLARVLQYDTVNLPSIANQVLAAPTNNGKPWDAKLMLMFVEHVLHEIRLCFAEGLHRKVLVCYHATNKVIDFTRVE